MNNTGHPNKPLHNKKLIKKFLQWDLTIDAKNLVWGLSIQILNRTNFVLWDTKFNLENVDEAFINDLWNHMDTFLRSIQKENYALSRTWSDINAALDGKTDFMKKVIVLFWKLGASLKILANHGKLVSNQKNTSSEGRIFLLCNMLYALQIFLNKEKKNKSHLKEKIDEILKKINRIIEKLNQLLENEERINKYL